jgi:hypothetical protein
VPEIPDAHHISRFCKASQVEDGKVQAVAFMLRPGEPYLSVNWLEYLGCTNRDDEIAEMRRVYSKFTGQTAKIAILNVGNVRENVLKKSPDARNLSVRHSPLEDDGSHSAIYNLRDDDDILYAELIKEKILASYPARA